MDLSEPPAPSQPGGGSDATNTNLVIGKPKEGSLALGVGKGVLEDGMLELGGGGLGGGGARGAGLWGHTGAWRPARFRCSY